MDETVLWQLSYGMYAIGAKHGAEDKGCIVNTIVQITAENPIIAVSMNKDNYTYEVIRESGQFAVSILGEEVDNNVIAELGFSSGRTKALRRPGPGCTLGKRKYQGGPAHCGAGRRWVFDL